MEVCVLSSTPARQDINSGSGSSTDLSSSSDYSSGYLSMNDLKICLAEFVSVEDIGMSASGFNVFLRDNKKCNVVREDKGKVLNNSKTSNSASEKCFSGCVTFPVLAEPKFSVDGLLGGDKGQECKISGVDESAKSVNACYSQSISLPSDAILSQTPLKPVSALKGSRKKQGIKPNKLSVTWAPDVYDPIPTAELHVPSSKNQRYHNDGKKYGKKNKHKGGGKSSSKGKDKKQARKKGGGTTSLRRTTV